MCKRIVRLGLIVELLSAFFSVCSYYYAERCAEQISKDFFIFFRYLFQLCCLCPVYSFIGSKSDIDGVFWTDQKWWLVGRSFLGVLSFYLLLLGVQFSPLADFVTIAQCAPVLTFPLAHVLLRESIGRLHVVCLVLCVIGVALVCRPTLLFGDARTQSQMDTLVGVVAALSNSLVVALIGIVQRKMTTPPLLSLLVISLLAVPVLVVPVLVLGAWRTLSCQLSYPLMAAAFASSLASFLRLYSSSLEKAHLLALLKSSEVPLAFFVQLFLVAETVEWTSYAGAGLISLCVFVIFAESVIDRRRGRRAPLPNLLKHHLTDNERKTERIVGVETCL